MYGIWSTVSRSWCFGIMEPTAEAARFKLKKRIGKDSYKWRFEPRQLPKSAIAEIEASNRAYRSKKEARYAQ